MTDKSTAPMSTSGEMVERLRGLAKAHTMGSAFFDKENADVCAEAASRIEALEALVASQAADLARAQPTAFAVELGRKLAIVTDRAEAAEARARSAEAALAKEG